MEKFGYVKNSLRLMACLVLSVDRYVYGCSKSDTVQPNSFMFIALPSINGTLGEKLELKCSVGSTNSTLILDKISMYSRMQDDPLNTTCKMFDTSSGECSYTIPKLELWHRGTYDCIKFYKGGLLQCVTKTLTVSVSEPRNLTLVHLHNVHSTTERAKIKANTTSMISDGISSTNEGTRIISWRHSIKHVFALMFLGVLLM